MSSPLLAFNRTHLAPGTRLTVAVSGGADSVALLRTLHAANSLPREALGVGLSAVHVHHGIRGEAAGRDQAFVETLCGGLGVPLTVRTVDTPTHAAAQRETLEEAARTLRYTAFHDLLATGAADAVATAHTRDDQAETVLLKLLRGAWTEGLAGIYPILELPPTSAGRGGCILRPLLGTSRAEIESYLQALNQSWVTDETNADPAYTRNRLRHELLPALRAFNPALDLTLSHLAEIARDEESHWQAELARLLPHLLLPGKPVRGGGRAVSTSAGPQSASIAIEIERLRALSLAMRRRVLRAAARQLGSKLRFTDTERLQALCGLRPLPTVSSRPGSSLDLPGNLHAERSPRELRLFRRSQGVEPL